MASNTKKKFGIEFEGFEELLEEFKELEVNVKPIAEKALKESHAYITPKLHDRMKKNYMPAKGAYMKTAVPKEDKQIIDEVNIQWEGNQGTIDVGFSLDEGLTPIFLIYGTEGATPTDEATGLKATLYGKKTKEEIAEIQSKIFYDALAKAKW